MTTGTASARWTRYAAAACLLTLVVCCLVACKEDPPKHTLLDDLGVPRPEPPSLFVRIVARMLAAAVATPIAAVCLFAGARLTKVEHATFQQLLGIAAVGQALGMIPYAGPLLGLVAVCVLVRTRLEIDFFWEGALMVLVAQMVATWMSFVIRAMVAGS